MRYFTLLYYSLINLGLGNVGPVNTGEVLFCVLSMVISSLVYTNIFSSIFSLNEQLLRDQTLKQIEIDDVNNILVEIKMPSDKGYELK